MKILFEQLMKKAITQKVSDIHFIPAGTETHIKFRVKGDLIDYDIIQRQNYVKLLTYMKYLAGLDVSTHNKAQSGRYLFKHQTLYYLRVSTLPLALGIESCVIRVIPQYFQSQTHNEDMTDLYQHMNKKQGLILFSGPTGSGKSTLMYQMVAYAKDKLNLNIIAIEDPVERLLQGITQISVNTKAGIDYASSLKAILRCDPDIILVGEIRDASIAKQVLQASLSGHLVLSTIHAEDCKGVILRLQEMGVTEQEMKQAILCISNQRLIKDNEDELRLVCEIMKKDDINYFFDHEKHLPKQYQTLSYMIQELTKAGVICEEVANKYT
ncbi:competence type IV pilus ATPase ComGA [Staphylococcus auricularis]|uniref:competence type IV pilus ATPase ComGA n=1 Tax=Staphylococcus auricularis TaxID=29379 RepID=UPI000D1B8934|nr:competence type IV pilus ATPase ComGA [Staphylococcus auricularis]MEB6569326.1 Flp pilus assembly complex ATPase component TadA [Staphylococcus auricularis]PTH26910.1 competence protein ComGA [Staphylococcus auricularis]